MQIITIEDKAFKFELVEGKPMVSSLDVALNFEKLHKNVIKTIEDDSVYDEFLNGLKIKPVEYKDKKGEMRKAYLLDRDVFAYFVMGFTGEKAKRWKLLKNRFRVPRYGEIPSVEFQENQNDRPRWRSSVMDGVITYEVWSDYATRLSRLHYLTDILYYAIGQRLENSPDGFLYAIDEALKTIKKELDEIYQEFDELPTIHQHKEQQC